MVDPYKYDVFLSYAHEDKELVQSLANKLVEQGLKVWFDERAIDSAANIPQAVVSGLRESRCVIICVSENAIRSKWCHLELSIVISRDPNNQERRFVPLLLDDCAVPEVLQPFRCIKVESGRITHSLVAELLAAVTPDSERGNDAVPAMHQSQSGVRLKRTREIVKRLEDLKNRDRGYTIYEQAAFSTFWIAQTNFFLKYHKEHGQEEYFNELVRQRTLLATLASRNGSTLKLIVNPRSRDIGEDFPLEYVTERYDSLTKWMKEAVSMENFDFVEDNLPHGQLRLHNQLIVEGEFAVEGDKESMEPGYHSTFVITDNAKIAGMCSDFTKRFELVKTLNQKQAVIKSLESQRPRTSRKKK